MPCKYLANSNKRKVFDLHINGFFISPASFWLLKMLQQRYERSELTAGGLACSRRRRRIASQVLFFRFIYYLIITPPKNLWNSYSRTFGPRSFRFRYSFKKQCYFVFSHQWSESRKKVWITAIVFVLQAMFPMQQKYSNCTTTLFSFDTSCYTEF